MLFCLFFLNPAAEIMLNMLFNTLLKITPHNRPKRSGKKKAQSRDLHGDIHGRLSIQFLAPPDRA